MSDVGKSFVVARHNYSQSTGSTRLADDGGGSAVAADLR